MQKRTLYRILLAALAVYILSVVGVRLIAGERFYIRNVETDEMLSPSADVGEITAGTVLRQPFSINADAIRNITVFLAAYDRENTSSLLIRVENAAGAVGECRVAAAAVPSGREFTCYLPEAWPITAGEPLWLVVTSDDAVPGNAVTAYYGSSIALQKGELQKRFPEDKLLTVNQVPVDGILCFRVNAEKNLWFGHYYWQFAFAGLAVMLLYSRHLVRCLERGRKSWGLYVCMAFTRYRFLVRQLVARDFKAKYKRSVLGILWSLLNPLLTVAVQYIVFSTIFKSSIENYVLYLLIGIVCFNFFSEATAMSLTSILGNAQLITKVYIPKYIFPVTRTISSSINLLFSLIPIAIAVLLMRTPVTWSLLLAAYALACLVVFCIGVGMALSAVMVFFRDIQFLWNVFTMIIFYGTPILYPEQLLSGSWQLLFKVNPLYHVIRFLRIVVLEGVSPEPQAYMMCFLGALLSLLAGALIFRKTQDQFALNL